MVLLVNGLAAGGTGLQKWQSARRELEARLGHPRVCMMNGLESTRNTIEREFFSGETRFVAAGGDGTINFVANTLIDITSPAQRHQVSLGAIGIGSSNDFHKPLQRATIHEGIAVAIDFEHPIMRDIGCLTFVDDGKEKKRYFLINASVGATANANAFFNAPDRTLSVLKRLNTGGAILYSALRTIVGYREIPVQICSGTRKLQKVGLSNLGVVKNPWFSGNLCYGGDPDYEDGLFGVFLCHSMKGAELLQILGGLQRGFFPNSGMKTDAWKSSSISVSSEAPFAVEFDGEVVHTTHARFDVLPHFLKVCT